MNGEASRSALRALEIFEAFRSAGRPLSLSEIARQADVPISTCHGVLKALELAGFVYTVGGRDLYPTRRLWDLAREINERDPIISRLEPALARLRDELDETVILGVRRGDMALYLLVLESTSAIRYSARAGEHKPLHSSAIGKVFLGSMPPDALDAWLKVNKLTEVTPRTKASPVVLKADLASGRKRGYYLTQGENVSDVMGLAAPLSIGDALFGVALAGPLQRMQRKERSVQLKLMATVERIQLESTVHNSPPGFRL